MNLRSFTRFGSVLLAAVFAPFAAQTQDVPAGAVPIEPLAHLSTIQVRMNGEGPFTFVVDTGSGIHVINRELAFRLEIPVVGSAEVGSPMGTAPMVADSLSIGSLEIGDVVVRDSPAVALDLEAVFAPLPVPDGILAAASVECHLMTLDFPAGYLRLAPGALAPADGGRIVDYDAGDIVPRILVKVAGESVAVALDCGAPSGLTLPYRYADVLPLASPPAVTGRGRTADAEFEIRTSELLGTVSFANVRVDHPTVAFNQATEVANLGMAILRDYVVTIDRSHRRLAFERPAAAAAGAGGRMVRRAGRGRGYGIRLGGLEGDTLDVMGTDAGLPAALAGLRQGDRIVALNGTPVEALGTEARIAALRGSPLVVTVDRRGERLELTMSHLE